jgi:cell division initiation protein
MKLTALEIKQQKFEKVLRGYDPNEVNAFLNMVSLEWENLVTRQRDMERDVAQMKDKLKHYERVESALHETLQAAKESAEQRLNGAKNEARARIEKAELEAESILRDAQQQRQSVRQDILRLVERRDEIVRGIKSYLDMATQSVNSFSRDDASIYSLPKEEGDAAPAKSKAKAKSTPSEPLPTGTDDLDAIIDDLA